MKTNYRNRFLLIIVVGAIVCIGVAQAETYTYSEDFESGYEEGAELRTHDDWFYEGSHSGPKTQSGIGVNGSWGLTDGDRIFTWVAHPFSWSQATDVNIGMDFKTDGSGHCDDDRLGWMISDTDDDSSNIFGVQIDPGGSGYNIEGYWDGVSAADKRPSIVDLPALSPDSWYRFQIEITKLSATSASIYVELWSLNASGNPDTLVASGTIADTSALGDDAPNSKYFTATTIWPAYKNYTTSAAAADNAYFQVELGPAPPPVIIKGPYLQQLTPETIVIMWETDISADSWVDYGGPEPVGNSTPVRIHEIELTGLTADTMYYYTVTSGEVTSDPDTFVTAPSMERSFRFASYGDTRTYPGEHTSVIQGIINSVPEIVLHTGDLVTNGKNYSDWGPQFFDPAYDLMINTPLLPVLGNHEYDGEGQLWFLDFFSLGDNDEWFAFTYGCVRFIGLNTNVSYSPGSLQYNWLENELVSPEYADATWHIVYFHHPPYTATSNHSDDPDVKTYLVPLFEQYGVDLVFNGHSHVYERYFNNGVYYIVTGGGGAPLQDLVEDTEEPIRQFGLKTYHHCVIDVNVPAESLTLSARYNTGEEFDTIMITKVVNNPPVANDDAYSTEEDTPLSVSGPGVLSNDSDADGDPLTAVLVSDVSNGTLALNSDGSFSYTPNAGFSGTDSFTYRANDGISNSNVATVTITVTPVNDPPLANNDSATTQQDTALTVDVLANDTDADEDPLTVTNLTQPSDGTATINADQTVTYTPDAGYTGEDSFTYTANDGTVNSNVATVIVTVNPPEPITLFSDGFESGDFTTGGWTTSGDTKIEENVTKVYTGSCAAKIKKVSWIEKALSTAGFMDIGVKYARKTKGFDTGEWLFVEWSTNGSDWYILEQTKDTAWSVPQMTCGSGADDNSGFRVRFRNNTNKEEAYIDDVEITGTPLGPVDNPPSVTINEPADGATFASGTSITFAGTATDAEDGDVTNSLTWESSIDGPIGTGASFTVTLADGGHIITASVTDSGGNTGSASVAITVGDPPPSAPKGLVATPGDAQVSLDWDDNTESDLARYNIYRSTTSGSYDTVLFSVIESAHVDLTAVNGTTYYYVVTAVDGAGNESEYSEEVSATPEAQVGDVVTVTKAEYKPAKLELNVEATSSEGGIAVLTVEGYGVMTYDERKNIYKLKVKPVSDPGGTVTVTSSLGGSDSAPVTYK